MLCRILLLPAFLVLSLLPRVAVSADDPPARALDLIPQNAAAVVAIDNLSELKGKGERLFDETGMPRISVTLLFQWMWGYLKIKQGVDKDAAAAVIIAPERETDAESDSINDVLRRMVFVVPVKDVDAMAANFEMEASDFERGEPIRDEGRVLLLRGKHLYLGGDRQAVMDCVNAKRLSAALDEDTRKQYSEADILVLLGTEPWGHVWREMVEDMKKNIKLEGDPEGAQVARSLVRTVAGARYALAAVRVDDGIAVSLSAFLGGDPEVTGFLQTLRGGPEPSTLAGLPEGRPVAAFAARGEGTQNVVIARAMVKIAMRLALDTRARFSSDERSQLVTAFGRTWGQLNGSRLAVYRTENPDELGLLCLLAVFDPDDPRQFIDVAYPLVRLVGQSLFRWSDEPDAPPLGVELQRNAERLGDRQVDVVQFDADALDDELCAELARLLGPQWHRLKICTEGPHVVVMLGSDSKLMQAAVDNIKAGKRGLADHQAFRQAERRVHKGRKVEVYLSLDEGYELGRLIEGQQPNRDATPCRHMTSTALSIHDNRVQLDVWVPTADLKTVARANGLTSE